MMRVSSEGSGTLLGCAVVGQRAIQRAELRLSSMISSTATLILRLPLS
jgi:hypothetical protein